jgi:hypothetical protein
MKGSKTRAVFAFGDYFDLSCPGISLDHGSNVRHLDRMLQHNTAKQGASRAHWAHAALVGMHALCCGLPMAMAVAGVAIGALAWAGPIIRIHTFLHGYEPEMLMVSFALVAIGGFAEWRRRAQLRAFPKLYALSLICFLANAGMVTTHWLNPITSASAAQSAQN